MYTHVLSKHVVISRHCLANTDLMHVYTERFVESYFP